MSDPPPPPGYLPDPPPGYVLDGPGQFFPDTSVSAPDLTQTGMPSLIPSFGHGFMQPFRGAAQLGARTVEAIAPWLNPGATDAATEQRKTIERSNQQATQDYQATRPQSIPGSRVAETVGEMVPTAAISYAMPGAAAPGILARTLSGVASGGISGATQPVDTTANPDFWKEKALQTGVGAATGGGTTLALGGMARLADPTPAARTLLDQGVTLTPGQILGGAANRIEQGATSFPVVGDAILNARYRAKVDFNRASVNQALAPIGETLDEGTAIGHPAIAEMAKKVGDAYDRLIPQLSVTIDPTFHSEVANLTSLAQYLPADRRDQFNKLLTGQVLSKFSPNGTMTGETFKEVESTLGQMASQYRNSTSADERQLGGAFLELQGQLRSLLERSNPDRAAELQAVNTSYANMLRVQGAASQIGAKNGIFTGDQLLSSVRQLDPTLRKSSFGRGGALMQDFAEAGANAMRGTLPDSGSAYRLLTPALAAYPAFQTAPMLTMALGGLGAGATAAYSPWGSSALAAALHRFSPLARGAAPGFSAASGPLVSSAFGPLSGAGP